MKTNKLWRWMRIQTSLREGRRWISYVSRSTMNEISFMVSSRRGSSSCMTIVSNLGIDESRMRST